MKYYLAIDLGTTGCRSIIFDSKLNIIGDSYCEYQLKTIGENQIEQDAELWWELSLKTAKNAIKKSEINPILIKGISISSQGITIVPVDKNNSPLCDAISWLDIRAEKETEWLIEKFGIKKMFSLTGKQINACYSLPKILWFKNNRFEIYKKAYKILMPMDFLIAKLTGAFVTDHSMASGTMLYDLKNGCWSKNILQQCDIDINLLPELKWSGEPAGTVLPQVAKELGISENCIVAVGAQDQRCASLGVGLRSDTVTVSLGTACAVCKYQSEPKTDDDIRIGWSAYIDKKSWVTEGVVNTAAVSLRWLRDAMFPNEDYATIDKEALLSYKKGTKLLFYPYLNGPSSPDNYPDSEGSFYGLSLATVRGDFALAVMEGVAFQIRILLEAMNAWINTN